MHFAYSSSSVYLDWYISRVNPQSNERKRETCCLVIDLDVSVSSHVLFSPITHLGGDTSVDSLVESTLLRKFGGKVLLVLFEHLLVVRGQAVNLVNVRNLDSWERNDKSKVVVRNTGCCEQCDALLPQ